MRSMNVLPSVGCAGLGMKSSATLAGGVAAAAGAEADKTSAQARTSAREARCTRRHYNLQGVPRNFVKFTFLKVDPAWRRLDPAQREQHKREFLAACENFGADRFLRAFSLVGTRGDTDLLLWSSAPGLADIHEFHVVLGQSGLMGWSETPYSYLAMTKESEYSEEERLELRTSERKYLFVYPFWKQRDWYRLPGPERMRIMREHIEIGQRYPTISINTTYSFGLDDQEFVVAFETDEPGDFLDLVQELRGSESSSYTLRDTPIFTCISSSVRHALDALDGESPMTASTEDNGLARAPAVDRA
jgi:chlorite dismutase